jgi:hypothetical protein
LQNLSLLCQALVLANRTDVALKIATSTGQPSFSYMLDQGPGTIWYAKCVENELQYARDLKKYLSLGKAGMVVRREITQVLFLLLLQYHKKLPQCLLVAWVSFFTTSLEETCFLRSSLKLFFRNKVLAILSTSMFVVPTLINFGNAVYNYSVKNQTYLTYSSILIVIQEYFLNVFILF